MLYIYALGLKRVWYIEICLHDDVIHDPTHAHHRHSVYVCIYLTSSTHSSTVCVCMLSRRVEAWPVADCFPLQEGVSAAHSAVRNGHLAIVKFLIEECNCGTEEKTHVCVLMHACMHCACVFASVCLCVCTFWLVIQWLVQDVGSMFVCTCMHVQVCILCVYYITPSLWQFGDSLLHFAALHHQSEVAKYLVAERGVSVNDRNTVCVMRNTMHCVVSWSWLCVCIWLWL